MPRFKFLSDTANRIFAQYQKNPNVFDFESTNQRPLKLGYRTSLSGNLFSGICLVSGFKRDKRKPLTDGNNPCCFQPPKTQDCTLCPETQKLVSTIFNDEMLHNQIKNLQLGAKQVIFFYAILILEIKAKLSYRNFPNLQL